MSEPTLVQMRQEIYENEASFNKRPLASKLTPTGRVIVTEDHVTTHEHEEASKKPLPLPFDEYVKLCCLNNIKKQPCVKWAVF
ncbi:hypothetical protein ACEQPO_25730 [Bacillus sp. SL00103]